MKQQCLWEQAFGWLIRNRVAVVAAIVLTAIVVVSILVSVSNTVARYHWNDQTYTDLQESPSRDHLLGTDNLGSDLWARMWEGTTISLKVGIGAQGIIVLVGLAVGAGAALGGRWADGVLMRLTDVVYAFPDLLAIILMRAILFERGWPIIGTGDPQIPGFPGRLIGVIIAIAFGGWVTLARLIRGQMLSLREQDYVTAARAVGATQGRIVLQHMLPNTLGPVIVAIPFGIPTAIFAEAVLGFIGFGLPPPTASLGTLVNDGYVYYRVNQWMIIVPSTAIALLMLCFTFLGDGLDPRTRK